MGVEHSPGANRRPYSHPPFRLSHLHQCDLTSHRDQLIPPTAGLLPITGPLGVLGVQRLVPGDDPKSGDLLGPLRTGRSTGR